MAKAVIFLCLLLLVVTLSKSAPILDEEIDDDLEEDLQERRMDNADDGDDDFVADHEENDNSKYDEYGKNDMERKDDDDDLDEDEDNEQGEKDVLPKEVGGEYEDDRDDNGDDDGDDDESDIKSDDETVDTAANRVVEESEGKVELDKNLGNYRDDLDEGEDEDDEDMGGEGYQDMGEQIVKLKKIFNEDMPKEIGELKSNSKTLNDDLDNLNAKLEQFLRENGIKQEPALPVSDSESDYKYI